MDFLDYYRENLAHIRSLAAEFSAEFPKIAGRLELSEFDCQDPYVERLLEGTAFLAARVEKKLESGRPRLLESVLSSVAPMALFPIPSYAVLELQAEEAAQQLKGGVRIPRGAAYRCEVPGVRTPCTFSLMEEVNVYPLRVAAVSYCTREVEQLHIGAGAQIPAALVVRIECTAGKLEPANLPERLDLFLNLPDDESSQLQEQLCVDLAGVYAGLDGEYQRQEQCQVEVPMFSSSDDRLFARVRCLEGLQIMQRFLTCPALFKFVRISNFRAALEKAGGNAVELVFALRRRLNVFINRLEAGNFRLWCVPAVNLFLRSSDRSEVNGQFEYHVVPDRTAPKDYEVFKVLSVETINERNQTLFECGECYDESDGGGRALQDFFTTHRRERLVKDTRMARSSYCGTEVFVSFSGENWRKRWEEIRQFQARMVCTNRDLPLLLSPDAHLNAGGDLPVAHALFMTAPSRPRKALIANGTADEWRKVGHIVFNLSSSLWRPGSVPLAMLRDLIAAYSVRSEEETARLTGGICGIRTAVQVFRFIHQGCVFFENGWKMELTLNSRQYAGTGVFIFALVLKTMLASYTPINSCVELVLHTEERQNVVKWTLHGR